MKNEGSNKNNNKNKSILSLFSGQDQIYTIPRIYVKIMGSHTDGLFLNQCIFYSGISKRPNGEFYKTYDDWYAETDLTKRQVTYASKKMKALGFLETRIKRANNFPTVHYTIKEKKIIDAIYVYLNEPLSDNDKMSQTDKNDIHDSDKMSLSESDKMSLSESDKMSLSLTDELPDDLHTTTAVVVVNSSITKKILKAYRDRGHAYPAFETEDKLLDAVNHWLSIIPKEKSIAPQARVHQLIKFIEQGEFYAHADWTKQNKVKSKNKNPFGLSDKEMEIAADYRHALKSNNQETWYPDVGKRKEAHRLFEMLYPNG